MKKLLLEREFEASAARVFAAWMDIDKVRRWFGCGPGQLWDIHEWDCRVGGRLFVSLTIGDKHFEVEGEFLEVDPPRRIVYRWDGDERVEVSVHETAGGCRLELLHIGLDTDRDCEVRRGGWTFCLGSLADAVR